MSTTTTIVGTGKYTYEVHEDWARLPDGWTMPAAAVTVDSQDRVYCFNRTPDHPVVVFDRDGNYLRSWGAGLFAFPHTIRVDARDNLWLVDRDHGQMMYFTPDGELLRTIGTKGTARTPASIRASPDRPRTGRSPTAAALSTCRRTSP